MESALRQGAGDPDLRLIETLLFDGARFPRLDGHMARLVRSARWLGWDCDGAAVTARLQAVTNDAPARVRLLLGADGGCALSVGAVPEPAAVWRVGLASARLDPGDPWLRVKTTRRAAYDAARAALADGLDEVIFLNGRGEVCDGSITTVFFDRGQGMRTPPLSSGLLPGVLRAEMGCPDEVLLARDLPRVRLWVGNALRGLIPAEWAG